MKIFQQIAGAMCMPGIHSLMEDITIRFTLQASAIQVKENEIIILRRIRVVRHEDGTLAFISQDDRQVPFLVLARDSIAGWVESELIDPIYQDLVAKTEGADCMEAFHQAEEYLALMGGKEIAEQAAEAVFGYLVDQPLWDLLTARNYHRDASVDVAHYNWAVPHARLLKQLQKEAGQAFPVLYQAVRFGLVPVAQDALSQLRKRMLRQGHSPAAWRFLVKDMPQRVYDDIENQDYGIEAQEFLDLSFAMAGILAVSGKAPSDWLRREWTNTLCLRIRYGNQPFPPPWFRRAATQQENKINTQDRPRIQEQYHQALIWITAARPHPDKQQLRAGWQWICKQSERWAYEQWKAARARDREWESSVEEYCDAAYPFILLPLTSEIQLIEEGDAMHHCVGSYAPSCRDGESRIFSIRHGYNRVATVELCCYGNYQVWEVEMVKGHCNGDVAEEVYATACRLAEIYGQFAVEEDHFSYASSADDLDDEDPWDE